MARHRTKRSYKKKPKPTVKAKSSLTSLSLLTLNSNSQNDLSECNGNINKDTKYDLSESDGKSDKISHLTVSEEALKSVDMDAKNMDIVNSSSSSENVILELLKRLRSYCWRSYASESKPEKHILLPKDQKKKKTGKERFENDNISTGEDRATKNVVKPMRPRPEKYTSINDQILEKKSETANPKLLCRETDSEPRIFKAQKIILTALKYGIANGLVKKNGKKYSLTTKKELKRLMKKNKHWRVLRKTDESKISKLIKSFSEEDISCLYTKPAQAECSTTNLSENRSCGKITREKSSNSETDLQSNCKTAASKQNKNNEKENKVLRAKSAPHKLHSCCKHPSILKNDVSIKRKRKLDKKSLQCCSTNDTSKCTNSSPICSKKAKSNKNKTGDE